MQTLIQLLHQSATEYGSLPALKMSGGEPVVWTYAELLEHSRHVASYLRDKGVKPEDRVVLWGANGPEWVAAFFGVQLLGAMVIPLDLRSLEDFLIRIEEQTDPVHIIAGKSQTESLEASHAPTTSFEDLLTKSQSAEPIDLEAVEVGPDTIAELVFTSGTTGAPKGVMLTHHNIVSNVGMAQIAFPPTPDLRLLSILPLSHMFEQTIGLFTPLSGGSSVTYIRSLRPDLIFKAMNEQRITVMACVPQVLELFRSGIEREVSRQNRERQFELLHKIGGKMPFPIRKRVFRTVHQRMGGAFESFLVGGAYLNPDLARWWEAMGIKVLQGYGMTEASPMLTASRPNDRDPESVGRSLPGVELRITDEGEILARGDCLTPGYWNNPEATAEAFTDGWYHTGDLGYIDHSGRLHLRGRLKNMIVLPNGMKVHPEDIEPILVQQEGIEEAVVIGLTSGQDVEVHAVVRPEEDSAADIGAAISRANERLAPHQRIRGHTIWPDDEFPITHTLKVKRMDVQSRVEQLRTDKVLEPA